MSITAKLCACAFALPLALAHAGSTAQLTAGELNFQTSPANTAPYIAYLSDPFGQDALMRARYIVKGTLGGMCDDDLGLMNAWASIEGESIYRYTEREIAYQTADDGSMPFNPFPHGLPAAGIRGKPAVSGDQTFTYDNLSASDEVTLRQYDEL